MGIPILVRWHLYIETAPRLLEARHGQVNASVMKCGTYPYPNLNGAIEPNAISLGLVVLHIWPCWAHGATSILLHNMYMLWEKFKWILTLCIQIIICKSTGFSCLFSLNSPMYCFCVTMLIVISQLLTPKKIIIWIQWKNVYKLEFYWSFCVNHFLRYHYIKLHQPIVKRVSM